MANLTKIASYDKIKIGGEHLQGGAYMLVSKYTQYLPQDDDTTVIWHSVFGRVMQIPSQLADYLKSSQGLSSHDFAKSFGKETLAILREAHIIVSSAKQERADIDDLFFKHNQERKSKVKYLSLIMSDECPFRCVYCIHFANSKHYYNQEKMMSFEIAKTSIDNYLELMLKSGESDFYINFGGGEPLLNYPVIVKILLYIKECEDLYGIKIKLGLNTNLSLLTREMAETFAKYDVEIAASLDGTKKGNDKVRLSKNLTGTYDSIIRGFNLLKELGRPLDGFAMTVTEANLSDVDTEIIDWASSLGMTEIRIDIDVVGIVNSPMNEVIKRLARIREYAAKKGITVIGFWSRPAENLGLIPEEDDIGFCGGERGNSLCVAPSGQVFPCGYSNYQLGNYHDIPTIYNNDAYAKLLKNRNPKNQPEKCQKCPIFGFCRGGCLITKEVNQTSTEKQSAMCELYVGMTQAIIRQQVSA